LAVEPGVQYVYTVRALDRRGQESPPSNAARGAALPEIKEPVFTCDFSSEVAAKLRDGKTIKGAAHAGAQPVDGALAFGSTGFATFQHLPEFEIRRAFSLECWARVDQDAHMPVVAAAGSYNASGWFLQRFGRGWRWHVAPVSCDGGRLVEGQWTHLVGVYDGRKAHLYQDGELAASVDCRGDRAAWTGGLILGQYTHRDSRYQVVGSVTGLRVYHRALRAPEVAEKYRAGRP
jgi:hypothetical protein